MILYVQLEPSGRGGVIEYNVDKEQKISNNEDEYDQEWESNGHHYIYEKNFFKTGLGKKDQYLLPLPLANKKNFWMLQSLNHYIMIPMHSKQKRCFQKNFPKSYF